MAVDNLVDVFLINIRVPGTLRVNHHHWPFLAAVQATGVIDPHLALTRQTKPFYAGLGIIAHGLGIVVGTTWPAILAQVGAKKYVVFIVGFVHLRLPVRFRAGLYPQTTTRVKQN